MTSSEDIRKLGRLIREKAFTGRNPFFCIRECGTGGKSEKREITPDIMGEMMIRGEFSMHKLKIEMKNKLSDIEIWLYLNEGEEYLISGFPRCVFQDEKDAASTLLIHLRPRATR